MAETETINLWVSNYGHIHLTPWLAERANAIRVTRRGEIDRRFKQSLKFAGRMERLMRRRYEAEIDG